MRRLRGSTQRFRLGQGLGPCRCCDRGKPQSNLDADTEACVPDGGWDRNLLRGGGRRLWRYREIEREAKLTAAPSVMNVAVRFQIQIGEHAGEKIEARDEGPVRQIAQGRKDE